MRAKSGANDFLFIQFPRSETNSVEEFKIITHNWKRCGLKWSHCWKKVTVCEVIFIKIPEIQVTDWFRIEIKPELLPIFFKKERYWIRIYWYSFRFSIFEENCYCKKEYYMGYRIMFFSHGSKKNAGWGFCTS